MRKRDSKRPPLSMLAELTAALRNVPSHYRLVDLYFEAAWTDSWSHRRCLHRHPTLIEAAKCAMPQGPAWYVLAVENGRSRQLTEGEEQIVDEFRFASH